VAAGQKGRLLWVVLLCLLPLMVRIRGLAGLCLTYAAAALDSLLFSEPVDLLTSVSCFCGTGMGIHTRC
jgi:hypothetical protein